MTYDEMSGKVGVYALSDSSRMPQPDFISFGDGAVLYHWGTFEDIGPLKPPDPRWQHESMNYTRLDYEFTIMYHKGNLSILFHKKESE